jgi:Glycosyl transferases group 1
VNTSKPKLLFFQYQYNDKLPAFLLLHKSQHAQCLAHFFEVTVLNSDCDFSQVCELHRPDLVVFEGGVPLPNCIRPRITGVRERSDVLKVGLLNADAFCSSRAGFLSDMANMGIETFFVIACTASEYTPQIAPNLIIWPNCIDPAVFHDYASPKLIPVLFTGMSNALYPWRQGIVRRVAERFPSLLSPHPGYAPSSSAPLVFHGERYARLINASFAVPACGTAANEIVRKHFEIPACNALLVTERTALLEAAGFVDMQNCIFASESDVVDKLAHVFANPDTLAEMTSSGYQLVHSRHTVAQRSQFFEWYVLTKALRPGERVIQRDPFQPLEIARDSEPWRGLRVSGNGTLIQLLRSAKDHLRFGRYADAERLFLHCLTMVPWMPEPKLGLARCSLLKGDAKAAQSWILQPIQFALVEQAAKEPDPVEWAHYIIVLLCLGHVAEAHARAREFSSLQHAELCRVRSVLRFLDDPASPSQTDAQSLSSPRVSIHDTPAASLFEWAQELSQILRACRRSALADLVLRWADAPAHRPSLPVPEPPEAGAPSQPNLASFKRNVFVSNTRKRLRQKGRRLLYDLEERIGFFLPYRLSSIRNKGFFLLLRSLAADSRVTSILIVGASPRNAVSIAALSGAAENPSQPTVFCIATQAKHYQRLASASPTAHPLVCSLAPRARDSAADGAMDRALEGVAVQRRGAPFSLVLIDYSEVSTPWIFNETSRRVLGETTFAVVLNDTYNASCHEVQTYLQQPNRFRMVGFFDESRRGRMILRKCDAQDKIPERDAPAFCS